MKKRYLAVLLVFLLAVVSSVSLVVLVNSLGGWRYIVFKVTHQTGATATATARAEVFDCLPTSRDSIVFIGDSLLAQAEWHELLKNDSIQNRAISGATIRGIANRVQSIVCGNPREVVFMAGINDLLISSSVENTLNLFTDCIDQIIKVSPETKIIVHTLFPVNNNVSKHWIDNSIIDDINSRIKTYCKNNGVVCIDINGALKDDTGNLSTRFTYDGLHINGVGYLKWKNVLLTYI